MVDCQDGYSTTISGSEWLAVSGLDVDPDSDSDSESSTGIRFTDVCLLRLQHETLKRTRVLHVAGRQFGIRAVAPEQVGPAGASNGPPGVLVQHKAAEVRPAFNRPVAINKWFPGPDKSQGTLGEEPPVGGDRPAWREFHADRPNGALGFLIEKNVAFPAQKGSCLVKNDKTYITKIAISPK